VNISIRLGQGPHTHCSDLVRIGFVQHNPAVSRLHTVDSSHNNPTSHRHNPLGVPRNQEVIGGAAVPVVVVGLVEGFLVGCMGRS